jgi:hypothetical protein
LPPWAGFSRVIPIAPQNIRLSQCLRPNPRPETPAPGGPLARSNVRIIGTSLVPKFLLASTESQLHAPDRLRPPSSEDQDLGPKLHVLRALPAAASRPPSLLRHNPFLLPPNLGGRPSTVGFRVRKQNLTLEILYAMRASCITLHSPWQSPALHVSVQRLAKNVLNWSTLLNGKHLQPLPSLL